MPLSKLFLYWWGLEMLIMLYKLSTMQKWIFLRSMWARISFDTKSVYSLYSNIRIFFWFFHSAKQLRPKHHRLFTHLMCRSLWRWHKLEWGQMWWWKYIIRGWMQWKLWNWARIFLLSNLLWEGFTLSSFRVLKTG